MKTKVFRVYCFAGKRHERTPETPVKVVTVYLPDAVLDKTPNPKEKAETLARGVLSQEILKDPGFKNGYHFEVALAEVDLSEYGDPNLESTSEGSKAWLN